MVTSAPMRGSISTEKEGTLVLEKGVGGGRKEGRKEGGRHTGNDLLCLFQGADGDVTGTRTDFDDNIGGLEVGLFDNGVADAGVLENMLAIVLVELEDVGAGGGLRLAIVGAAGPSALLLLGGLWHDVVCNFGGGTIRLGRFCSELCDRSVVSAGDSRLE